MKIPSYEEARDEVEAHWRDDYERALDREARRRVAKAEAVEQRTAAAAARAAARQRAVEQEHAGARKAYRHNYGAEISRRLDPGRRYDLIEIGGKVYACDPGRSDEIAREASRWLTVERGAVAVSGINLGAIVPKLAGVDPSRDELRRLAAELTKKERKEREAFRSSLAERDRVEDERRRYGVAVSDLPDPEAAGTDGA